MPLNKNQGFTLIEILVVVLIIGITVGFALLAFGDFGASRRAVVNAEQFSSYVQWIQQRAMIEAATFGIDVNPAGYTTLRFSQGRWQAMPKQSSLHWRAFPASIRVHFRPSTPTKNNNPGIVVYPTGNLSAFQVDFGTGQQPKIARLIGKDNGQLLIQR